MVAGGVRAARDTSRRMHLKAITLRGFKSFVDPVEIRLEPGVAVVVGPNGSGKSNVSDSILWATGSMSPGELRAEKPDDVLFAGSAGRQATDLCEVDLLFDNADGAWPELLYSEVSVSRRLQRGGEGQYLVNRTPVRRTGARLIRYWPSPPRCKRRVTEISLKSSSPKAPSSLSNRSSTSQWLAGAWPGEPAKSTSSGFSARSSLGLCEPEAQSSASATFDLPEPLGPTTTATPLSSRTSTG